MADIDESEGGEEEWVDPGEAPVPPDTGGDAPELPAEEESFETLGGVAHNGGEIIAPDITGGTITGSRVVSSSADRVVTLENGALTAANSSSLPDLWTVVRPEGFYMYQGNGSGACIIFDNDTLEFAYFPSGGSKIGRFRLGYDGTINITNGACSLVLGTDGSITARRGSQSRAII